MAPFSHEEISELDLPSKTKVALGIMFDKHPKLNNIPILQLDMDNRAAYYHHGDTNSGNSPYVAVSDNWEKVIVNRGLYAPETQPLREIIQKNLGVAKITPEFLMTFVLLHEYGHSYFYYGMSLEEKIAFDQSSDNKFAERYGANSLAEFDINFPQALPIERLDFARAYRNRVKERRADSLACEIFQQVARKNPELFPEIRNLTKNYS